MTTTAGDDYKQSNKYDNDNDNDNDDKTPAKGQERFNRENSNKRRRVGNNVSLLICMWTWTHRLELGLGFGFPCPRRCRFTIEFLIGSAGTHMNTHALGIEKHLNLMAVACTLYGPREWTRSRLESKLRPGTLTASAPCDGIPRKQQQHNRPIKIAGQVQSGH